MCSIWLVLPHSYLLHETTALKELFDVKDALRFYRLFQSKLFKDSPFEPETLAESKQN